MDVLGIREWLNAKSYFLLFLCSANFICTQLRDHAYLLYMCCTRYREIIASWHPKTVRDIMDQQTHGMLCQNPIWEIYCAIKASKRQLWPQTSYTNFQIFKVLMIIGAEALETVSNCGDATVIIAIYLIKKKKLNMELKLNYCIKKRLSSHRQSKR